MIPPLNHAAQISAQVAAEAIINDPEAYSLPTIEAVAEVAARIGVSDLYVDPLLTLIADLSQKD